MPGAVRIRFEATGGQEWALWTYLVTAGIEAVQLAPAQIKAFARSRGTRAKTDRIDAVLIAGFMQFRLEAGRVLPHENLRILRALTTRRAQIVDMRKRLAAQIYAREKQGVAGDCQELDSTLKAVLDGQIIKIEPRIEQVIVQEETLAKKARLLRSIPGIGPVSADMLIAEMPELGRMTAGEAAAMMNLSHSASFHSWEKIAPLKFGIKHPSAQHQPASFFGSSPASRPSEERDPVESK